MHVRHSKQDVPLHQCQRACLNVGCDRTNSICGCVRARGGACASRRSVTNCHALNLPW